MESVPRLHFWTSAAIFEFGKKYRAWHYHAGEWQHPSTYQGVCVGWIHVTVSKLHKQDHFPNVLPIQSLWCICKLTLPRRRTTVRQLAPSVSTLCHNNKFSNAAASNVFFDPPSYLEFSKFLTFEFVGKEKACVTDKSDL